MRTFKTIRYLLAFVDLDTDQCLMVTAEFGVGPLPHGWPLAKLGAGPLHNGWPSAKLDAGAWPNGFL